MADRKLISLLCQLKKEQGIKDIMTFPINDHLVVFGQNEQRRYDFWNDVRQVFFSFDPIFLQKPTRVTSQREL